MKTLHPYISDMISTLNNCVCVIDDWICLAMWNHLAKEIPFEVKSLILPSFVR